MTRRWFVVVATIAAGCGRIDFDPLTDGPCSDPDLAACFEFESSTADGTLNHNDAAPTGVTYGPGHTGGMAVIASAATSMTLAESPSLDISTDLTIELWLRMSAYPPTDGFVFDNDNQYGISITPAGRPHAVVVTGTPGTPVFADTNVVLPLNEWHHLAMRYDSTSSFDFLIDGVVQGSTPANGPISVSGTKGSRIAGDSGSQMDPLAGSYDDLKIWRVARSNADL